MTNEKIFKFHKHRTAEEGFTYEVKESELSDLEKQLVLGDMIANTDIMEVTELLTAEEIGEKYNLSKTEVELLKKYQNDRT